MHIEQDVQLIMHSENVLCDRNHYLRTAGTLWAELDALNKAGRGQQAIAQLGRRMRMRIVVSL